MPLDQPLELAGEWWLPGNDQAVAPGRLTYVPREQLRLELVSDAFVQIDEQTPVVLGMTVEGRPVTLVNVHLSTRSVNMPGGIRTTANVNLAFIGMHAATQKALRLHSLQARVSHLTEWLGQTAIDVSKAVFPAAGTATWRTPGYVALARVRGALVGAQFEIVGDRDGRDHNHRVSLEQRSWISVNPTSNLRHFDELDDLLEDVRKYLAFATGVETEILELKGEATVTRRTFGPRGRTFKPKVPVWVLYRATALTEGASHPAREMLFRHRDSRFSNYGPLTRWCRRARVLEPIYNLYLTAQPRRGLYIEFRFLAMAQALEALHARLHPRSKATLRQRLDALTHDLPKGVQQQVPASFLDAMVDTRNYFTHWDPKKEPKALRGAELFALTEGAKLLLEVSLLTALGFSKTQIDHLALTNKRIVNNIEMSFGRL